MKWYNWILCLVNKERREALHKVVEEQRKKDAAARQKKAEEYCEKLRYYGKYARVEGGEVILEVGYDSVLGAKYTTLATLEEVEKLTARWLAEKAHNRVRAQEEARESLVKSYNAGRMDEVERCLRRPQVNGTISGQTMYWTTDQFPDPAVSRCEIPPKAVPSKRSRKGRKK